MNHSEIVSFLWGVADLIRDTFKRGKYQDIILPLTVLRRLDCVLARTKAAVLARRAELRDRGLQDPDAQLRKASGFAFYNTSRYDFEKLLADAPQLAANLRNYIAGFSPNMREVLDLGPEHRVTLGQMMDRLDDDAALDTAARGGRAAGCQRSTITRRGARRRAARPCAPTGQPMAPATPATPPPRRAIARGRTGCGRTTDRPSPPRSGRGPCRAGSTPSA